MRKVIYVGDSFFFFQGISSILKSFYSSKNIRCDVIKNEIIDTLRDIKILEDSFANIIVFDITTENVVDCAIITRKLSMKSKKKVIVIGNAMEFNIFRSISGFNFPFLTKFTPPEEIGYMMGSKIYNEYSYSVVRRSKTITKTELEVLGVLLNCQEMEKAILALNKHRKTISCHRQNIACKLGMTKWQFMSFVAKITAYRKYKEFSLQEM